MWTLLIADPHAAFRQMASHVLAATGYSVAEALTAKALLRQCQAEPSLILLLDACFLTEPSEDGERPDISAGDSSRRSS